MSIRSNSVTSNGLEIGESSSSKCSVKKSKKFSKRETRLILDTIYQYIDDKGLQLSDIVRTMRDNAEKRSRKNYTIWNTLKTILPHRTKKVRRKLTQTFYFR